MRFWPKTKIFIHNYVWMWKLTTATWIILNWTIQFYSLKFVSNKCYLQTIAPQKSLNPFSFFWNPNHEKAQSPYTIGRKVQKMNHCTLHLPMCHGFIKNQLQMLPPTNMFISSSNDLNIAQQSRNNWRLVISNNWSKEKLLQVELIYHLTKFQFHWARTTLK